MSSFDVSTSSVKGRFRLPAVLGYWPSNSTRIRFIDRQNILHRGVSDGSIVSVYTELAIVIASVAISALRTRNYAVEIITGMRRSIYRQADLMEVKVKVGGVCEVFP